MLKMLQNKVFFFTFNCKMSVKTDHILYQITNHQYFTQTDDVDYML